MYSDKYRWVRECEDWWGRGAAPPAHATRQVYCSVADPNALNFGSGFRVMLPVKREKKIKIV